MNTIKKIEITRLTENFVELIAREFVEIDGKEVKLSIPHVANSYVNSETGRQRLQENEPENIVDSMELRNSLFFDLRNVEGLFQSHYQFHCIERVCTKVVNKRCLHSDRVRTQRELLRNNGAKFLVNHKYHLKVIVYSCANHYYAHVSL